MAPPKVSIIWLNYNSSKIMDIVLRSLESICDLNYPRDKYELIVVDNGSTDGSLEKIKKFLEGKNIKKKIIELDKNIGFTGGNNVAFRVRDRESKYVVLLNNDAVPLTDSLRVLVECAEQRDNVGAVQGIIIDDNTGKIDTAGNILSEFLVSYQLYHSRDPQSVKRSFYITYTDGAYSLLRVDHVKKATGFDDKLFYDEMFAYFEDCMLGLQLWNAGFKVLSCPVITALHRRSSTFGKMTSMKVYLITKGYYTLNEICNSRFRQLIKSYQLVYNILGASLGNLAISKLFTKYREAYPREAIQAIYRGYLDGIKLGKRILRKIGKQLDLYKAPCIKYSLRFIANLVGIGTVYAREMFTEIVTREFESKFPQYVAD